MGSGSSPYDLSRFCVIDVGSTTTKAILFSRDGEWCLHRAEAPTTVEKPYEDVTVGVLSALRALESEAGVVLVDQDMPAVPCFSTSSAGGGLAVVVAGLVRDVTSRSAERVALGAGALIQDVIALDDGRTPYKKIEMLRRLRPDMVLLAGGFDGGAIYGPVFLAELINQAGLRPKLSREGTLPVIFAGNSDARSFVRETLDANYSYFEVPNLRPSAREENLEPSRDAIHDVFMGHVMSRAPGYEKFKSMIQVRILPTPAAVGKLLAIASKNLGARILAVDIGGATTDVFTAEDGQVFRTVSANLGMSYSILNVVEQAGVEAIRDLLDFEISRSELLDRIGNKFLQPTSLPSDTAGTRIECAVAAVAIREAVKEHFRVMHGVALSRKADDLSWSRLNRVRRRESAADDELSLADYDAVVGSGGMLSHSPRKTAAMIMLNALQPEGTPLIAVDSVFLFPHLGALSQVDPDLAMELFYKLGMVRLGRLVAPSGKAKTGSIALRIDGLKKDRDGEAGEIECGDVRIIEAEDIDDATVAIRSKKLRTPETEVDVGECRTLIVDARGRPACRSAGYCIPDDYVVPRRSVEYDAQSAVSVGELREPRQLAVAGRVFVKPDDIVSGETVIAKSTKSFLRPFFLDIAGSLSAPPEIVPSLLGKNVGDEIEADELLAQFKPGVFSQTKKYKSPVSGKIEKILPTGTIIVREKLEHVEKYYSVKVAEELGVTSQELDRFMFCAVGDEVEKGQKIAGLSRDFMARSSLSPIRGKIKEINLEFGMVVIEPLLEELDLLAWLPGRVTEVSDRGCTIASDAVVIRGAWGCGEEVAGHLCIETAEDHKVVFRRSVPHGALADLADSRILGLIAGSISLDDIYDVSPDFAVLVLEGFGERCVTDEVSEILDANDGALVCLDPGTQVRVGAKRPRIVIPQ